jgi:hypothetical protein
MIYQLSRPPISLAVFLWRKDAMKKFVVIILLAIIFPLTSGAYLLCERWAGFAGGWVGSPDDGWNHVYNWWGDNVTCS